MVQKIVQKKRGPRGLTPQEGEILALRSTVVRLTRELEEARETIKKGHWADLLTGLASRMRLEQEVQHHLDIIKREILSGESPAHFAVIFIDVDNFGPINKDFGHLTGDAMLKEFADYLSASTRSGDIIARFAGDEFVVLAPNTTNEQAKQLMGKIYDGLKGFHFQNGPGKLSISTGSSSTSEGLDTRETLLNTADYRMSARKRKNRVKD